MPEARLERVLCRNCKRLIFRAYLEGASQVELKCGHCNHLNLISASAVDRVLIPDGVGGYLTTAAPSG